MAGQFRTRYTLISGAAALAILPARPVLAPPPPPPNQVVLMGVVRDFPPSHPDFGGPLPDGGNGHFAGNVSQIIGPDGAPLQVHGVSDFDIIAGILRPGVPYSARLSVLGSQITSGGNPIPVTLQAETDTQVFEPFGSYNDPGGTGDVNDAYNPRHFIFSLDDIYSAQTPIAVKATSWMPSFATQVFGNNTVHPTQGNEAQAKQVATRVNLPVDAHVTKLFAYIAGDEYRLAIYSDNAGEPGNLIVQTTKVDITPGPFAWYSKNIADTWLAAGNYWLALSQDNTNSDKYRYLNGSGQSRRMNNNACAAAGFASTWGASTNSWTRAVSMYAEYTPVVPVYNPHLTANSGVNSQQVKVLKDGDSVPNIPAFQNQANLAVYVAPYVNVATQKITIQDNQAIYLFELGTTNMSSPAADFQDLVIMITLATDPVYFFSPGSVDESLNPIGYKVVDQWKDSSNRKIAPHLYTASLDDVEGAAGVISSGGVTSPATFYQWFRNILGENMAATHEITLTENNSGIFEYTTNNFRPIDGLLLGNDSGGHNRNFTYAVAATFTHDSSASQFFEFEGGDGAWLFINGKLAIDLGGVISAHKQYVGLNRLGLSNGQQCEMRLFYAERGKNNAFKIWTNVFLTPGPLLGGASGSFD